MPAAPSSITPFRVAASPPSMPGRTGIAALALALASVFAPPAVAQVGMARISLGEIPVTLVYPTSTIATPRRFGAFELAVAWEAPVAPNAARRPLVVMSHGTGGSEYVDHTLAAALARGGFIVAQPLHAGDNHRDASRAGPQAWHTRPAEVLRTIDGLVAHPTWGPLIDAKRVGVHGTSAGGATALTLAGARWRLLGLLHHCGEHLAADPGFCLYGAPDAAEQAMREEQFRRVRGVRERSLPAEVTQWHGLEPRDVRRRHVRVVTVSVPVAAIFPTRSLAALRLPVGIVAAQADSMLAPTFHSGRLRAACRSCETLADMSGATHFDAMHPWPDAVGAALAARQSRGVATNPAFDARLREDAYARIVRFHQRHLNVEPGS